MVAAFLRGRLCPEDGAVVDAALRQTMASLGVPEVRTDLTRDGTTAHGRPTCSWRSPGRSSHPTVARRFVPLRQR